MIVMQSRFVATLLLFFLLGNLHLGRCLDLALTRTLNRTHNILQRLRELVRKVQADLAGRHDCSTGGNQGQERALRAVLHHLVQHFEPQPLWDAVQHLTGNLVDEFLLILKMERENGQFLAMSEMLFVRKP